MAERAFAVTLGAGFAAAAGLLALSCDPPERESGQWPIALALLVESAQAAQAPDPGETAYRRTCIACHGASGRGNDQKTGADFTRPDGVLTKEDAVLLRSIREGKQGTLGVMPAHRGLLTDVELNAVLAYLRRTFGPGIAPVPAASGAVDPGAAPWAVGAGSGAPVAR